MYPLNSGKIVKCLKPKCGTCIKYIRLVLHYVTGKTHRGADDSLARPGRKQATATEDFEFHISYL
jgi:hypothetical protein